MTYPGGKGGSGVAQTLINLMPPHNVYVEAFLGSGAVLRAKRPASTTIGIDVSRVALDLTMSAIGDLAADGDGRSRWPASPVLAIPPAGSSGAAISDRASLPAASRSSSPVPTTAAGIARTDDRRRRRSPFSTLLDPVSPESAMSPDQRPSPLSTSDEASSWILSPNLTLLQVDAAKWLRLNARMLDSKALVYCDPPYVRGSRRSERDLYEFEMTDDQHEELLDVLLKLRCMVILSGYASALYSKRLGDWNEITFTTTVRSGALATEHVWFNYPKPVELHDYRYLGKNFRERERIKRKVRRWKDRLGRMPELEKQALLWAMSSVPSR